MKGKIFATLFALPFAGVGVWMLWSISSTLYDAWQMGDWVQVEARLIAGGYETNSGDDSDTYEAFAEYHYEFHGQRFTADRVGISSGGDNIGDYQQEIGNNLRAAHARGESILVYVDPENPSQAVIDRGVRWGLLGFKSIFVIVFGGVGFGLLYGVWRSPAEKDKTDPAYIDKPWLLNDDWQTSTVRSSSKASMWVAWGFAIFWNAISSVAPFLAYEEIVEKQNYIALIALLFPLVGIGLLVWAIRRTLEWRRFGAAPVTLDPFPGSIGGHVGGTIDVNLPFDPSVTFKLTLTNIHKTVSGSGDNRSQKEKALWQDAIIAHAAPGNRGTRLTFRFDVPDKQHASDTEHDDSYYLWRLNLAADLPGTDIDRDYDIPVYPTGQQSRRLSGYAIERARSEQAKLDEQSVRDAINLEFTPQGKRLFFPMGRNLGPGIGGLLVGAIFAGVGWFLVVEEGHRFFGSIFGGVGALIAVACFYAIFNSLEVIQTAGGIKTVRRLLGIPVGGSELRRDQVAELYKDSSMQSQSGGKHTVYYDIYARDTAGKKHKIGLGFTGKSEAEAALDLIGREFGLRRPRAERSPDADVDPLGRDASYLQ
jgi:hypothetical protein